MNDDSMIDDSISEKIVIPSTSRLVKSHRDLNVYQRAYDVSLVIHAKTLTFPKIEQYALADQLRRSSKSVCANIAEGFAKQKHSSKEFARFLAMAEASAQETQVWLEYAADLQYITRKECDKRLDDYIAVASMLNKLIRKI